MGRWSYQILKGRNRIGITIITGCRVSQTSMPPQHGKSTTFHQEYVMMSKAGVKQLFTAKHPKLHERKQKGWNHHSGRKSREGFKRLKQIFNPWQAGAQWSKVLVPIYDSAGIITSWKTEFESNALKNALLEHCQERHYRKASCAQFGHGPTWDLVGLFNGMTEAADQILEGTLFQNLDDACSPEVIQLIAAMVVPDELQGQPQMNTEITEDDFRKGIKEWKETTSTSPSNRHLGHNKVEKK